jgi:hypothetical protein
MRHFVAILAALTLTECALPGASGTSFMSSMHPTQEFCASRGLTLDATTKQCVTPPQPAPVAADVTGSLPEGSQTPAPAGQSAPATSKAPVPTASPPTPATVPVPPPPDEHQARPPPPVEPDAVIHAELRQDVELMFELVHYVRASGYRCASISGLQPLSYSKGFKLVCDHFSFRYAIEEKDGRTTVTVQ